MRGRPLDALVRRYAFTSSDMFEHQEKSADSGAGLAKYRLSFRFAMITSKPRSRTAWKNSN
jgi:hypothetical protein